jgi:hypothetical protein
VGTLSLCPPYGSAAVVQQRLTRRHRITYG